MGAVPEEAIRDRNSGIYYYVDAVCFGMERLGHPDCIPLLARLHSYPFVHGLVASKGPQADFFPERQAYLELVVGRTLARSWQPQWVRYPHRLPERQPLPSRRTCSQRTHLDRGKGLRQEPGGMARVAGDSRRAVAADPVACAN